MLAISASPELTVLVFLGVKVGLALFK